MAEPGDLAGESPFDVVCVGTSVSAGGVGFRVFGFAVCGSGCGVWGLGLGVWCLGFAVCGLRFAVWGLGFGVLGCHLVCFWVERACDADA